jgi:hypothetical protein
MLGAGGVEEGGLTSRELDCSTMRAGSFLGIVLCCVFCLSAMKPGQSRCLVNSHRMNGPGRKLGLEPPAFWDFPAIR